MASLSSSLSSLNSSTISIGIAYGDENRRMWFPTSMPWSEVRSSILSCYLLSGLSSDYRFSYTDEEGDAIVIEQENEYLDAKRSAASKGSYLQLSLIRVAQNGAPLSSNGRSKDDFAGLEDNSDLEDSYVSVNDVSKTPSNQLTPSLSAANEEKKADNVTNADLNADASDDDEDDNMMDDALSALQEIEQQPIKMPINEQDEKASPPPPAPITPPPPVSQDSSVSSLTNVSIHNEPKKSENIEAALAAVSSLLSDSDAQEGLVKTVASSLINYCISIASPSDADLIRSSESLLVERVNDGVKGRINNGLLARLLVRRLFWPRKKKTATKSKKSPKSKPNEDPQQKAAIATSASSASISSSSSSGSGRAVHHGVTCDECTIGPIMGARYHCITCDESDEIRQRGGWDCCEECETKTKHCTVGPVRHVLIKMKTPAKIVVDKEQPSQQFIASGHPLIYDAFAHFGDESKAVPVGVVESSAVEPKKSEKKMGKKYAKKMIKMLLQQFSDDSFTSSSDSSSDDESAQRKLTKKMEKQKKKADKAMKKAEKLKLRAEKKAGKAAAKSAANMDEDKKEHGVEKKEEIIEKKEENKEEPKANEQENQEQQPSNSSVASENQSPQLQSAADAAAPLPQNIHNPPEPIINIQPSYDSSAASSSSPSVDQPASSSMNEEKANVSLPFPIVHPVPLPVAHPVISFPPAVPSLPPIIPAPLFPSTPSSLPPSNPFTLPTLSPSIPSSAALPPSFVIPPLFFAYPDQLSQLTAMGFPRERSMELLNYYSGDLRKALNRLL